MVLTLVNLSDYLKAGSFSICFLMLPLSLEMTSDQYLTHLKVLKQEQRQSFLPQV